MADRPNMPELTQGHAAPSLQEGITRSELLALVVSAVWVVLICGLLIIFPSGDAQDGFDPLRFVMSILAVLMPVGLLWAVLLVGRALRLVREDARRLGQMIDTLRQTVIADRSSRGADLGPVERKMSDIAQAARATEAGLPTFSTKREPERQPIVRPLPPRLIEEQPALALGTAPDEGGPPLLRQDMIRALNFPDTDKDEEGFSALRRALKDRQARQLVQASQDVLTLLSQDGIYMDDLNPDRARPEVWRRFASGERGRTVAALGGVRDRSCLALTMGRMREDMIFRDAAHHFLRLFDRMLVAFEPEATDEELSDLSETRTARAFMLLGRVTGAFD
jgi:hypothetical protein